MPRGNQILLHVIKIFKRVSKPSVLVASLFLESWIEFIYCLTSFLVELNTTDGL